MTPAVSPCSTGRVSHTLLSTKLQGEARHFPGSYNTAPTCPLGEQFQLTRGHFSLKQWADLHLLKAGCQTCLFSIMFFPPTTDDNLGLSQDKLRKSAPDLCILHRGTHSITCTVWEGSPCESPIMGTIQCSRIFHGTGTFFCPRQHLVNIPTCSFPSAKPTDQVCPT